MFLGRLVLEKGTGFVLFSSMPRALSVSVREKQQMDSVLYDLWLKNKTKTQADLVGFSKTTQH